MCSGRTVIGARECIQHGIGRRLQLPMPRLSNVDTAQAPWSRAGGMGRRSGRLVRFVRFRFLNFVLCIVCGAKRWPLPAGLVYFGDGKEALQLGASPFSLFRPTSTLGTPSK